MAAKTTITLYGLMQDTARTMQVRWKSTRSNIDHFKVRWGYAVEGPGNMAYHEDVTVDFDEDFPNTLYTAQYTAPDNAHRVNVGIKPISKKKTVNGKETDYWTASWVFSDLYYFEDNPPVPVGTPTVELNKDTLMLTARHDNLDPDVIHATDVQFQIVQDDTKIFKTSANIPIELGHASYACTVPAGHEYKVRSRTHKNGLYSDWYTFSSNYNTPPSISSDWGIGTIIPETSTSVYLSWPDVVGATTYTIEYVRDKLEYLEASNQTTTVGGITTSFYRITGLETGYEYFFRIRAINDAGESEWSPYIASVILGVKPAAPTTWSSTTTAVTGDPLTLYWTHNSMDGSRQSHAEIEIYANGELELSEHIDDRWNDQSETEKDVMHYDVDTSKYVAGTKLEWHVRTAGVLTNEDSTPVYSDWSMMRAVDIYAKPTLSINVVNYDGEYADTITGLPLSIIAEAGPVAQTPLTYHLSIIANNSYVTTDELGNDKVVSAGDVVYSNYFDISDTPYTIDISAGDITLEHANGYTAVCSVSMNSGLEATDSAVFTVDWSAAVYEPDLEISIDTETYSATMKPYCLNTSGTMAENVMLAVYRREYDGSFIEIARGIANGSDTYITDPHPALDYARYRVVATSTQTGETQYYDPPAYPIGGKAVIIQWDEDWSSFNTDGEDLLVEQPWSGSMLTLPYNIDISDSYAPDVSLVKYIGRNHPVTYYGTHQGETSTWNMDIIKSDEETLYALRRLAKWMGDVYVREPSGSGYWANVTVSFSQRHKATTIPVTLQVKRVEGGM